MNAEIIFDQFPVLTSGRSILKKVEDRHLDELFEIYDNEQVFTYCGIVPKHNKDQVGRMIGHFERDYGKRSRVKWGIFATDAPDGLLGILEAMDFNYRLNAVTIGYYLAEAHWGKGIAAEAVRLLVEFLFLDAGVNRIQAEIMPANKRSRQVLLKNGFQHEGTLRQAAIWTGKGIIDLEIHSLLREEYTPRVDE